MAGMFSAELAYRTVEFGGEAALRSARHVLHLDCSHGPASLVAHGAERLFAELGRRRPDLHVEHVRLWEAGTRSRIEYGLEHVRSKMAMLGGVHEPCVVLHGGLRGSPSEPGDLRRFAAIEELAAQVATARGLVVSAPMWNYSVPWVLKQYFSATPAGPLGLLGGGRPVVIVTSSGGAGGKDYLVPWLRDVAGMMGFDDATIQGEVAAAAARAAEALGGPGRAAEAAARVAAAAGHARGEEGPPVEEWDCERVLQWLRAQGGLSADALESMEAVGVSGELLLGASEDDWREEELGLEEADVARAVELQGRFRALAEGGAGAG
ncbi:unnamed protein product [Prorocentrum cordatum]|uniref:SAM domain-containing protein n=1 Tax=Prorocentrum cordatum TaxID=2364126 RepID=A0ABN9PAA5_9DINO|nr:unnamed protein product [Polarella glacialis]